MSTKSELCLPEFLFLYGFGLALATKNIVLDLEGGSEAAALFNLGKSMQRQALLPQPAQLAFRASRSPSLSLVHSNLSFYTPTLRPSFLLKYLL